MVEDGHLVVRVAGGATGYGAGGGSDLRLHVFATVLAPSPHGAALASLPQPALGSTRWRAAVSRYVTRTLPEEVAYVLARGALVEAGKTRPSTLLPRPSLLLHPWSLGVVTTETQTAAAGTNYARHAGGGQESFQSGGYVSENQRYGRGGMGLGQLHSEHSSLGFLPSCVTLLNLRLNEGEPAGEFRIPLPALFASAGAANGDLSVSLIAVDAVSTASAHLTLAPPSPVSPPRPPRGDVLLTQLRDLTRGGRVDPTLRPVQQSRSVILATVGESVSVAGEDSRAEAFCSVQRASALLCAMNEPGGASLTGKFADLLRWPTLSSDDKRRVYGLVASHEAHLFLFFHDHAFFEANVAPSLSCKRDKSFVDHWLLGHSLAPYTSLVAWNRLNVLERALLLLRPGCAVDVAAALLTTLLDSAEAQPTPRSQKDAVFAAALALGGLSSPVQPVPAAAFMSAEMEHDYQPESASIPRPAPAPMMMARSMKMAGGPRMMMGGGGGRRMMETASLSANDWERGGDVSNDERDVGDTDMARRADAAAQPAYRPLDATQVYIETHYHAVQRADTLSLVPLNEFWAAFARHCASIGARLPASTDPVATRAAVFAAFSASPFLSPDFGLCGATPTAAVCALAVLGLPWAGDAVDLRVAFAGGGRTYTHAGTPAILFLRDLCVIREVEPASPILLSERFYDPDDEHEVVRGRQVEKFLPGGSSPTLIPGKAYGLMVVVSNTSASTELEVDVLTPLPEGALPLSRGAVTRSVPLHLEGLSSSSHTCVFYFPSPGVYPRCGSTVSTVGDAGPRLLASAPPTSITVAHPSGEPDTTSWSAVAATGSLATVLAYLRTANTATTNLNALLWRCSDAAAWRSICDLLASRCWFHPRVWSYALLHGGALPAVQTLLAREESLAALRTPLLSLSPLFDSPALRLTIVEEGVGSDGLTPGDALPLLRKGVGCAEVYEHREFAPLVHARAHQLGVRRRVLNKGVEAAYRNLLAVLVVAPRTPSLSLALVYHLLLADRAEEAQVEFSTLSPPPGSCFHVPGAAEPTSSWCALQYDYLAAYLALLSPGNAGLALATTAARFYASHPVPRWAARFAELGATCAEISGSARASTTSAADAGDREAAREAVVSSLTSSAPTLHLEIEGGAAVLTHTHQTRIVLNIFATDTELLFSSNPLLLATSRGEVPKVGLVRPTSVIVVNVGADTRTVVPLPESLLRGTRARSLLVEAVGGGNCRQVAVHIPCSLVVEVSGGTGRLTVRDGASHAPLPGTYVKVFACGGSAPVFYKDTYTDARGMADYFALSSSSKTELKLVALVASATHGCVVREVPVPQ